MVATTVEKLSPTRVKLNITVTPDELKPSIDHAYKHIAESVTIPGFRKGKVPPPIIDQRVDDMREEMVAAGFIADDSPLTADDLQRFWEQVFPELLAPQPVSYASDSGARTGRWLFGLGTTIWSPLASGILTGKYNDGIPADSRMNLPGYEWLKARLDSPAGKDQLEKVRQLAKLAGEVGLPIHHLALLWCLANPHVSTVILGASRLSQLKDNLKALDSRDKLTPDVLSRIEAIAGNKPAGPQRY